MRTTLDIHHGDVALDSETSAQIRELARAASDMLDRPIGRVDAGAYADAGSAGQLLDQVWDQAIHAIACAAGGALPQRILQLSGLLARVRDLESRVNELRVTESVDMMHRIRKALTRLQSAPSTDELLALAAEQTCTLGFDRALVSTVDDGVWNLHSMHIPKDPRLAEEMVAVGREAPPRLDGSIVESDVVARARPGLVYDVQANPRVNRKLVSISGCTSYGVAPMTANGAVIGLIHADSHYAARKVDRTDRAVLNLYAEAVGQHLSRVALLEGVASLTGAMARLTGEVRPNRPAPTPAPPEASHPSLSAREAEVIELMASGDGNRVIARKLCISEATVKTHISHILRKLDASNRAEAVAYWLRR